MKKEAELVGFISTKKSKYPIYYIRKNKYTRYSYVIFWYNSFFVRGYGKYNKEKHYNLVLKYANKINKYKSLAERNTFDENGQLKTIYILGNPCEIKDNYIFYNDRFFDVTNISPLTLDDFYKSIEKLVSPIIEKRYEFYKEIMGLNSFDYKFNYNIGFSSYGSNNRKNKKISFNYCLFAYSIEIIDSVIIHELSHCVHYNHSKDFYNLVYKFCPNYDECRKKLIGGCYS